MPTTTISLESPTLRKRNTTGTAGGMGNVSTSCIKVPTQEQAWAVISMVGQKEVARYLWCRSRCCQVELLEGAGGRQCHTHLEHWRQSDE